MSNNYKFYLAVKQVLNKTTAKGRANAFFEMLDIIKGAKVSNESVVVLAKIAALLALAKDETQRQKVMDSILCALEKADITPQEVLDLSNDTEAEREQLGQKVFAFISNPTSDQKQVEEIKLQLNELLELFPEPKPDWTKSQGLITALVCETNAYIYRETFTEIVGILDLSNYPQNGCLDLAKNVSEVIQYGNDNDKSQNALDIITEMHDGLSLYTPEFIAQLICDNPAYLPKLQDIFKGENNNENLSK